MLDRMLNPSPSIHKRNKFIYGFLPGLFCPLLAFVFFYATQMRIMGFAAYMSAVATPDLLSKILSFGCIINLGVFYLFLRSNYDNAARGVIGATILWALPIIWVKFILQ